MRRIGVMNYKGGTGKTATVVHLAHGIALQGYKVLIIDVDPQGSVGYHLGINQPKNTLYNLISKNADLAACITNARHNLDVICANEHLFPAEMLMAASPNREHILSDCLQNLTHYDFVFLDCAPSMSLLNQNALLYSNELFIPVSMEYFSLLGIKQLLKNVNIINKLFKKQIEIRMVIPTFYDKRNKKSKDVIESIKRVFNKKVSAPIRISVSLSEAPGVRQTVFEYASQSTGAVDYKQLVQEVLKNE
jgi:chromosome partitioning protein